MNRSGRPLNTIGFVLLFVTFLLAVYEVSLLIAGIVPSTSVLIAYIACTLLSLAALAIGVRVYGKPHIHTSVVSEVWIEYRNRNEGTREVPLDALETTENHKHVMFSLASGFCDYRLDEAGTAADFSHLQTGDLVIVERSLVDAYSWTAKIISITPKDELQKFGTKPPAKA